MSGISLGVRLTLITLILLAVFSTVFTTSVSAEFSKISGLMPKWHKARICMTCHAATLPEDELNKFLQCSPCHNPDLNLRDPVAVERIHGVNVCIKCHVGADKDITNLDGLVHVPHKNVKCENCHGTELIFKPKKSCDNCHKGGPHAVHSKILNEICVMCHSKNIRDYTGESPLPPGIKVTPTPQPVEEQERFSLAALIIKLLSMIFGA